MFSLSGPSWSPDGRTIACGAFDLEDGEFSMRLLAIGVEDGSSTPIGSQKWSFIGQVAWLGNGSGVVFSAWQLSWGVYGDQLWLLTYPKGRSATRDERYEQLRRSQRLGERQRAPHSGYAADGSRFEHLDYAGGRSRF